MSVDESFDPSTLAHHPSSHPKGAHLHRDSSASSTGGFGRSTTAIDYLRTKGGGGGEGEEDEDIDEDIETSFLAGAVGGALGGGRGAAGGPLEELNVSALGRLNSPKSIMPNGGGVGSSGGARTADKRYPPLGPGGGGEDEDEEEEGFCSEGGPLNIIPTKVIRTRLESLSRPSTADPSLIPSSSSSSTEPHVVPAGTAAAGGGAGATATAAANNRIRNTALEEGRPSSSRSRPSLLQSQKSTNGSGGNNNNNNNSFSADTPSSSRPGSMHTSLLPGDAPFLHSLTPTMEDGGGAGGNHNNSSNVDGGTEQQQLLHEGSASSQSTRNVTMTPIMSTEEAGGDANALPDVESPVKGISTE